MSKIIVMNSTGNFIVEDGKLISYSPPCRKAHEWEYADIEGDIEVVIPEQVTSISKLAFKDDNPVVSVFIPETVTEIEEDTFNNCEFLASIQVSKENPYYYDKNGGLYSKKTDDVIWIPAGLKAE